MKLWIDAQLPPQLAAWLAATFGLDARPVRDLGLRDAEDEPIFQAARREGAVIMTKDADFEVLLSRFGPPPQVVWITCGNTANLRLREVLSRSLPEAIRLLEAGDASWKSPAEAHSALGWIKRICGRRLLGFSFRGGYSRR